MTFEEQWASARTHAAAKSGPSDTSDMTLASANSGESGGGKMVYVAYPWTNGARVLSELRTTTNTSVTQLADEKAGASSSMKGLTSVVALTAVQDSWHRRLKAVRDECENLEPAMRQAAKDHGENDARIRAAIAAEKNVAKPFEAGQ
ncbi:hypothetical protein [Streptomyces sp. NPDC002521]